MVERPGLLMVEKPGLWTVERRSLLMVEAGSTDDIPCTFLGLPSCLRRMPFEASHQSAVMEHSLHIQLGHRYMEWIHGIRGRLWFLDPTKSLGACLLQMQGTLHLCCPLPWLEQFVSPGKETLFLWGHEASLVLPGSRHTGSVLICQLLPITDYRDSSPLSLAHHGD